MDFAKISKLIKIGRDYGHKTIGRSGFTDTAHSICTFLFFHDEVSQETIATALMIDKTTVAKSLAALEAKGLVMRQQNPENRRKNVIKLTQTGKDTVADSVNVHNDWLNRICSCFTEQEMREFERLFDKLLDSAIRLKDR